MPNSIPVDKVDLEERLFANEVARYSGGSNQKVTNAIATAWSKARSAALNVFTPESWDALTVDTLPWEAKSHIVSDACEVLSAGSKRPDEIQKKADEAQQWRSWLVGDSVRCFDGILTRTDEHEDGVTYLAPEKKFDRSKNDFWNVPWRNS